MNSPHKQQNPWEQARNRGNNRPPDRGPGGPQRPPNGPPGGPEQGPHWKRLAVVVIAIIFLIYLASRVAPASFSDMGVARIIYLVALLAFVGTGTVLWSRLSGREFARNAIIWVGILLLATGIGAFWEDMGFGSRLGGRLVPGLVVEEGGEYWVQRRADGHFWVLADINGARIALLVDTGASNVVLSRADAEKAGIHVSPGDFVGMASTANGTVAVAPVRIEEIAVGSIVVHGVPGSVFAGELDQSLLGMSFLNALSGFAVEGDRFYFIP